MIEVRSMAQKHCQFLTKPCSAWPKSTPPAGEAGATRPTHLEGTLALYGTNAASAYSSM